jgi:hypothetical protein
MNIEDILKAEFGEHISLYERRPNIVQVVAPLYHEDGDMVDVFLDLPSSADGLIRISDHGMTLMRLSYSFEIDTPTKRKIFEKLLSENGVEQSNGRLYLETSPDRLYPALLQFAQTVAKVSNLQILKRAIIQNLFYETLDDFVISHLARYTPEKEYQPLPTRDDLDVDWRFPFSKGDIFLYGVRDGSKARLVGLTCLEFQKMRVPFRSVLIHEDFENEMSKKDQRRITNIADKQFASLDDFRTGGEEYFQREAEIRETITIQ